MIAGIQIEYIVLALAALMLVWQLSLVVLSGIEKRRRKNDISGWRR